MRSLLVFMLFITAATPGTARAQTADARMAQTKQTAAELEKTASALEEAIKQNPGDIQLYIQLGFTYAKLEKADAAQLAFENAVRLDNKKAIAHYMLGLIYEKKGLTAQAIAAWKACLDNATDQRMRETALKHLHHLRNK